MLDKVRTILFQLEEARTIEDMGLASFRLHPLKGERKRVLVSHGEGQLANYPPI